MTSQLQSLAGLVVLLALAWLFGERRTHVRFRTVLLGVALQFFLAILLLKVSWFGPVFQGLNRMVLMLQQATGAGTSFVFGYLGGAPLPFDEKIPGSGFILAARALPLVIVISALSALFYYWKVLPVIVRGIGLFLRKIMKISGALGMGAAANIFMGMIEAPLLIRPYLKTMSRSELFSLMTCGMATVAGTVMVLYATVLQGVVEQVTGHILTASIISVPAALTVAMLMVPETGKQISTGDVLLPSPAHSSMDAISRGTGEGLQLLINIIGMLIVMVALVHLVNQLLGLLPVSLAGQSLTLQHLLGLLLAPLMWLLGIPWGEASTAGTLMGTKVIINEFIAYIDLAALPKEALSERSRIILTYALCGFANPGSLGIMIAGLGGMVEERRKEIIGLGLRSIIAGTIATCMTGAVVNIIL